MSVLQQAKTRAKRLIPVLNKKQIDPVVGAIPRPYLLFSHAELSDVFPGNAISAVDRGYALGVNVKSRKGACEIAEDRKLHTFELNALAVKQSRSHLRDHPVRGLLLNFHRHLVHALEVETKLDDFTVFPGDATGGFLNIRVDLIPRRRRHFPAPAIQQTVFIEAQRRAPTANEHVDPEQCRQEE